jgi:hypothetical protein
LIQKDKLDWYVITAHGIDRYEENLAPSVVSIKKQERKMILNTLLESYNRDIYEWKNGEELIKLVHINDTNYLLGTVEYLQRKGFVYLQGLVGTKFFIRLTTSGFQCLQNPTFGSEIAMRNAYIILFNLENQFRQFISLNLSSKYGPDWWNKCISEGIRKKVDQMRKDEQGLGWQVSSTTDVTDYLLFEHLEKIITTNWNEVFESFFKNQQRVIHRLRELESIRNSIAHARTLSMDGMKRLEQYSQDLFNMISAIPK